MTEKLAYVISQSACAYIRAQAMIAENQLREMQGLAPAYGEDDFMALIDDFCIGHNSVLSYMAVEDGGAR